MPTDMLAFFTLGLVFFLSGGAFFVMDGTRAVSLAMLPLGIVFLAMGAGGLWRAQRETPPTLTDEGGAGGAEVDS